MYIKIHISSLNSVSIDVVLSLKIVELCQHRLHFLRLINRLICHFNLCKKFAQVELGEKENRWD